LADAQDLGSCTERCRGSTPLSCIGKRIAGMIRLGKFIVLSSLCLAPALAPGDAIWVGESTKNPIMAGDVHIVGIQSNVLMYTIGGGEDATKPLDQVQQMSAGGETDFNVAEQSYRDGKSGAAAEGYQRAIRSSGRDWVRDRSAVRLAELSSKLDRFDLAATAYVALVAQDPTIAAKTKPVLSEAAGPYYDGALSDIRRTLDSNKLSDSQRGTLLGFALDIYRAKNDSTSANQTAAELIKLGVAGPGDIVMVKLASARLALDTKDYEKAATEIQQNRTLFIEPVQQADALFILAQARDGMGGTNNNAEALKDLALAYMRAATVGRDLPGQPHVSAALLRVAEIEEELKEPQVALQLYRQISRDYSGQPVAAQAKAASDRLAAKGT
jgi:tetratricopeptide (TPR) repeat protein